MTNLLKTRKKTIPSKEEKNYPCSVSAQSKISSLSAYISAEQTATTETEKRKNGARGEANGPPLVVLAVVGGCAL